MTTSSTPIETERRFLIKKPSACALKELPGCTVSEITQTYLINTNGGVERVRMRVYPDKTVYTHTVKKRISRMSALEDENEISRAEYALLLTRADPARTPICKTRCAVPWQGLTFEIDLYPFWVRQSVMEVELKSEDAAFDFPPFVTLIREVTGNRAYSNNSLSLKVPAEDAE